MGPQDLKMLKKDASSNSTQSVIKISPYTKNTKKVMAIFLGCQLSGCASWESEGYVHGVCATHIDLQLLHVAVSGEPRQIET
jgi:hypothetical protein